MIGNTSDRWARISALSRIARINTRIEVEKDGKRERERAAASRIGRASSKLHKQLLGNDRPRYPAGCRG